MPSDFVTRGEEKKLKSLCTPQATNTHEYLTKVGTRDPSCQEVLAPEWRPSSLWTPKNRGGAADRTARHWPYLSTSRRTRWAEKSARASARYHAPQSPLQGSQTTGTAALSRLHPPHLM